MEKIVVMVAMLLHIADADKVGRNTRDHQVNLVPKKIAQRPA